VSNHGVIIIERRTPHVRMGEAMVRLPAGGFLQATKKGEEILAELVMAPLSKAKRIVDLFAGIGTFTLQLAAGREVLAIETDGPALAALKRAAHSTPALRQVKTEQRDLFARPMRAQELSGIDGLVFDPPRAGAEAQARELARSTVPIIIAVSCNVQSLARDAGLLIAGGYSCEKITPVDQFRHSPHIEAVAVFRKTPPRKRGRLLG
jgi:23S rRNA (uracil1939-C5)-methyltransferase